MTWYIPTLRKPSTKWTILYWSKSWIVWVSLICWSNSFVFNCLEEFCIKYQNYSSKFFSPSSGVSQGSNLTLFLFLLVINDLADVVSCQILMLDDLRLFTEMKHIHYCVTLQTCLDRLGSGCAENWLNLNNKCKVVSYSKN